MKGLHSCPKEQREAIRQLVHLVLVRDMGMFNPARFQEWIKEMDQRFRKSGLTLKFALRDRTVHFTVREIRTGRPIAGFSSSTRVQFDDSDVSLPIPSALQG